MFNKILNKLVNKNNLNESEIIMAMNEIMEGKASNAQVGAFLVALRMKGETSEEIVGCAKVMREKALPINIGKIDAIDTCGTGGDGKNTFNVSTISAIIAAAAGVTTVKHGNRSVSSKCGSADVLEALGVNIALKPQQVQRCIEEINIGFLFAPTFHISMKNVAPARKELGIRTIFNILGPLTNPGNVNSQIMGVFDIALTENIAQVLKELGLERAYVLHSLDGMDEISIFNKTKVSELKNGEINTFYINPSDYGLQGEDFNEISGNSSKDNAGIILDILKGKKGAARNIALLNAGAAIYIGNGAVSLEEGILKGSQVVDSGLALKKLNDFIAYTNRSEEK
ncbi:MAG: anthranilate phosphoribosyltransferase [Eubacteriaceae bacterium]